MPHTSIDPQAHWGKSQWHGWVYGWKLHVILTVADVWLPLAADVTPANHYDGDMGLWLVEALPDEVRFVLGDRHYNLDELRHLCADPDLGTDYSADACGPRCAGSGADRYRQNGGLCGSTS